MDRNLITLTESEIQLGAMVGVLRQAQNIKLNRPPAHGADDENDWQKHCEGALAEMAFARWLNWYWSGNIGDLKVPDVGPVQIRSTVRDDGCLILRDPDPKFAAYVLAIGKNGKYRFAGWIPGEEGKLTKYYGATNPNRPPSEFKPKRCNPCFWVEQSFLQSMSSIQHAIQPPPL